MVQHTDIYGNYVRGVSNSPAKISGYLSIFLAVISLGAVICFHFPEYFTTPEFRAVYPVEVLRWVLLACLVLAFGIALTSYAGTMGIGFNSDPDIVPDLDLFILRFKQAIEKIAAAANVEIGPVSDDVNVVQATLD